MRSEIIKLNLKFIDVLVFSIISTLEILISFCPTKEVTSPKIPGLSGSDTHNDVLYFLSICFVFSLYCQYFLIAIRKYWQYRENTKHIDKKYNTSLWVSLPDKPGILGDVTSLVGQNEINISSVEMMEKTKTSINFKFNLIISDLKNFTKLLSELKQRQYRFKIIRHTNKKYAFFKKLFKGLKKN